jgi:putative DNA primase/helicase
MDVDRDAQAFQKFTGKPMPGTPAVMHLVADVKRQWHKLEGSAVTTNDGVQLLHGISITPEPVDWLWPGFLACGKLHIIAGAPGAGKTTLALAFAATITMGGRWPDGTRAEPGNVLIWSGEDDVKDTLLPRLLAMGANPERVYFVGDVVSEGKGRPFDPSRDMMSLELKAKETGDIALLVVDPVVNVVSGDSNKNAETRRSLQPVVDLASRLNAAALGISHFTKGSAGRDPVERVTGSVAFGALPRVVFAAAKTTEEDALARRVLVRSKSNIGPDGGGFGYDLEQVELPGHPGIISSRVLWGNALKGTARELLATVEEVEEEESKSSMGDAKDFLETELKDGALPVKQIKRDAEDAGHSWRTIQRAKSELAIQAIKKGLGREGHWEWEIPLTNAKDAKYSKDSHQNEMAHLGGAGALKRTEPETGRSQDGDVIV